MSLQETARQILHSGEEGCKCMVEKMRVADRNEKIKKKRSGKEGSWPEIYHLGFQSRREVLKFLSTDFFLLLFQ